MLHFTWSKHFYPNQFQNKSIKNHADSYPVKINIINKVFFVFYLSSMNVNEELKVVKSNFRINRWKRFKSKKLKKNKTKGCIVAVASMIILSSYLSLFTGL